MIHFLYLKLRRPYRLRKWQFGSPHSTWPKDTCNRLWMRQTSIKLHSMLDHQVYMSLLICLLVYPMQVPVFVTSWRCALADQQYLMLLFCLDDICIFGSSIDEMLDRIAMVLQCLKDFNLKIKPKRLFFFQLNMLFLGHMLSKDGILPNPEKVSKVKNWPIPKMVKEVHLFLGLASYYQRFIPKFTKWANPLHDLICPIATKKKHARMRPLPLTPDLPPFRWDSDHKESFDRLKEALISSPILAYPDYNKPFTLETDASLKGLGAVLLQEDDDGNFHIISYASHMLKPYERSMCN